MQVPIEAASWARATGVEVAPEEYDSIPAFEDDGEGLRINSPAAFAEVSSEVRIFGRLPAGTVAYDVQVGAGLYPTEWLLIAEDDSLVRSGELTEWDVSGLSGLWAIQLQAWDAEGVLQRTYTVVTIRE
jgi:hypothetical protein